MNWFVIRHPETGGIGWAAESALPIHRGAGWLRVSDAIGDMDRDHLVLADYATAPDLDAVPASKTKPSDKSAETSKESS
jgi:hypothetical protein